jgi:RimJ/RimL family protein N-acetyltransferase/SAM-dependent methyltransferase
MYSNSRGVYSSNDKLSLVEYKHSDDRALYDNWTDADTQNGYNLTFTDTFEEFTCREIKQRFFAMIQFNGTREIIGAVGISPPETEADLAIWVFNPFRHSGYGTSAFMMATLYAVNTLGFRELHAGAYTDNLASQKMLVRCGYVPNPPGNLDEKHYLTGKKRIQLDFIFGGFAVNNQKTREAWNSWSDNYFKKDMDSYDAITAEPIRAFPHEVREMLVDVFPEFPDLRGKCVLVPSSGDNVAAFGFALLGASVTSTDIAERQLENAAKIAATHGWSGIEYIRADSVTLDGVADSAYDLIYTSNGAHVWIGDLAQMYRTFARKLKPGGSYVFFETHPFHRPFDDSTSEVRIKKPYTEVGPFYSERDNNSPTWGWRVEDFLRALLSAGFELRDYRDMQSHLDDVSAFAWVDGTPEEREARLDWRKNPWAALPSWMGMRLRKSEV